MIHHCYVAWIISPECCYQSKRYLRWVIAVQRVTRFIHLSYVTFWYVLLNSWRINFDSTNHSNLTKCCCIRTIFNSYLNTGYTANQRTSAPMLQRRKLVWEPPAAIDRRSTAQVAEERKAARALFACKAGRVLPLAARGKHLSRAVYPRRDGKSMTKRAPQLTRQACVDWWLRCKASPFFVTSSRQLTEATETQLKLY